MPRTKTRKQKYPRYWNHLGQPMRQVKASSLPERMAFSGVWVPAKETRLPWDAVELETPRQVQEVTEAWIERGNRSAPE